MFLEIFVIDVTVESAGHLNQVTMSSQTIFYRALSSSLHLEPSDLYIEKWSTLLFATEIMLETWSQMLGQFYILPLNTTGRKDFARTQILKFPQS